MLEIYKLSLDIGMRRCSVASVGAILAVATVHELLLAVVPELASHLLEAGLHKGHVGEGHTGATLFLRLEFIIHNQLRFERHLSVHKLFLNI